MKGNVHKQLYFIGLLPPRSLDEQVLALKQEFAEKYNSRHALRSPAHITLQMPFYWENEKEEYLIKNLSGFAAAQIPFELTLSGFGTFSPHTIFIDVTENNALNLLHQALFLFLVKEFHFTEKMVKENDFHPHMTVAFRDLEPQQFEIAWKEFKARSFKARFSVDRICLLKLLSKKWELVACLPFKSSVL